MTSNNEFALDYRKKLLDIHWRQWRALGVTYRTPPEAHWILDLEALFVSSLTMCIHDRQLLSACIEWLARNREWINLSRLKCIIKKFATPLSDSFGALLPGPVIKLLENTLRQYGFALNLGRVKSYKKLTNNYTAYEEAFNAYQMQDIVPKLAFIRSSPSSSNIKAGSFQRIKSSPCTKPTPWLSAGSWRCSACLLGI